MVLGKWLEFSEANRINIRQKQVNALANRIRSAPHSHYIYEVDMHCLDVCGYNCIEFNQVKPLGKAIRYAQSGWIRCNAIQELMKISPIWMNFRWIEKCFVLITFSCP